MPQKHLGTAKLNGDEFYVCVFCLLVHICAPAWAWYWRRLEDVADSHGTGVREFEATMWTEGLQEQQVLLTL